MAVVSPYLAIMPFVFKITFHINYLFNPFNYSVRYIIIPTIQMEKLRFVEMQGLGSPKEFPGFLTLNLWHFQYIILLPLPLIHSMEKLRSPAFIWKKVKEEIIVRKYHEL